MELAEVVAVIAGLFTIGGTTVIVLRNLLRASPVRDEHGKLLEYTWLCRTFGHKFTSGGMYATSCARCGVSEKTLNRIAARDAEVLHDGE